VESLTLQITEAEQSKRAEVLNAQNEVERILRELRVAMEEKRLATAKLQEMQVEFEDMKKYADNKHDNHDALERELKKLQEKHRETVSQLF